MTALFVILLIAALALAAYAVIDHELGPDPDLGDEPWFPEGHWR